MASACQFERMSCQSRCPRGYIR